MLVISVFATVLKKHTSSSWFTESQNWSRIEKEMGERARGQRRAGLIRKEKINIIQSPLSATTEQLRSKKGW